MSQKRRVEVFTAVGCFFCDEAVELVKRIADSSCTVTIRDMRQVRSARRAKALGIKHCPTVVVDGKITGYGECGVDEWSLREAGIAKTPLTKHRKTPGASRRGLAEAVARPYR